MAYENTYVFGEFILFIYHELTTAKFSVKKNSTKICPEKSRRDSVLPAIRKLLPLFVDEA